MLRNRNEIVTDLNAKLVEKEWRVREFGLSIRQIRRSR
jgi:hypothetical protein